MISSRPKKTNTVLILPAGRRTAATTTAKRAEGGGDQAERDERHPRRRIEKRPRPVDDPVGEKNGQAEEDHHPGAVDRAFQPARQKDLPSRYRKRMDQEQVPAEVELGEGGDDAAEEEEREKGQKNHREELPGQDVAELLDPLKIVQNPVEDEEGADPEGKTDRGEQKIPDPAVSGAPGGAPVLEGEQPGPEQGDEDSFMASPSRSA